MNCEADGQPDSEYPAICTNLPGSFFHKGPVDTTLRPFGITNNYAGCSQLIRAVEIVLEKPDDIQAIHKQICTVIAKEYDLQPRSVESNIRTLSDIALYLLQ